MKADPRMKVKQYRTLAEYAAMLKRYPWPAIFEQLRSNTDRIYRLSADVVYERNRLTYWQSEPDSPGIEEIRQVLANRYEYALFRFQSEVEKSNWIVRYLQENAE